MLAFLGNVGLSESLLLVVVAILVFGGRLPEVARDAMRVVHKVRRSFDELRREVDLGGDLHRVRRDLAGPLESLSSPEAFRDRVRKPKDAEEENADREDGSKETPSS